MRWGVFSGTASVRDGAAPGSPTGTADVEAGNAAQVMSMVMNVHLGATTFPPCPRCAGGTCDSGANAGGACTVHGSSALFGDDVSLDCQPSASRS